MPDQYAPSRKFGVFAVIGRSLRLFFSNFSRLFLLAFLPLLVFEGLAGLLFDQGKSASGAATGQLADMFGPGYLFLLLVGIFLSAFVNATLVMASYDAAVGDRSNFVEYLNHALKNILPLAGLSIAFIFMFYFGIALLVVPGLYVAAAFAVFVPAVLVDGAGWGGLRASAALTKGYRWPVLGTLCLGFLIVLVPTAFGGIFLEIGGARSLPALVQVPVAVSLNAVVYGLIAMFSTTIYLRLRELQFGGISRDISEIFD